MNLSSNKSDNKHAPTMKTVCGWCHVFLRGDEKATVTSHGICADCLKVAEKGFEEAI